MSEPKRPKPLPRTVFDDVEDAPSESVTVTGYRQGRVMTQRKGSEHSAKPGLADSSTITGSKQGRVAQVTNPSTAPKSSGPPPATDEASDRSSHYELDEKPELAAMPRTIFEDITSTTGQLASGRSVERGVEATTASDWDARQGNGVPNRVGETQPAKSIRRAERRLVAGLLLASNRESALVLREGSNRIGRHVRCDIVIEDPFLSAFQCSIVARPEAFRIMPRAEAANPVRVDGEEIFEATTLSSGARLLIGRTEYQLMMFI